MKYMHTKPDEIHTVRHVDTRTHTYVHMCWASMGGGGGGGGGSAAFCDPMRWWLCFGSLVC